MAIRELVAQGKLRYNLELDTLEYMGDFGLPLPVDFTNIDKDDILFLKANYNPDMIDRIIADSAQPK